MSVSDAKLLRAFVVGGREAIDDIDPDHARAILAREKRLADKAGRVVRPLLDAMDVSHGEDGKAATAKSVDAEISARCGGGRVMPKNVSGGLHKVRQAPKGPGKRTGHHVNRAERAKAAAASKADRVRKLKIQLKHAKRMPTRTRQQRRNRAMVIHAIEAAIVEAASRV